MKRSTAIILVLAGAAGVASYGLRQPQGPDVPGQAAPSHPGCCSSTNRTHSAYPWSGSRSSTFSRSGSISRSSGSHVSTSTARGGFGHSAHFSGS